MNHKLPEALRGVTAEDLPASLRDICEVIGLEPALSLVAAYGGTRVPVPASCQPNSRMARAIGLEPAVALARHYARDQIYIPSLLAVGRPRRDREIVAAHERGDKITALARRYRISERQVQKITKKARQ